MTDAAAGNGSINDSAESLEIVFWWLGDDPSASIEDDLDDYLAASSARSRRRRMVAWPARRTARRVNT